MRHHIVGSFLLLLCTFTSLGQGPQYWTPSGGPWYARVEDIAAGVKAGHVVLYVADSAETSLMKSTDRGESWTHVLSLTSGVVRCVATEKNNPDVVYAGVRGLVDIQGLYKSTDGGTTWGKLNGFTASPRFKKISVDPTNSNCVWVGSEVVYPPVGVPVLSRTTDGGVTWSARPLGHPDYQLSVSDIVVASANVVFVSAIHGVSTRGVWRTTDDGDTWDLLIEGMAENNREISALA